MGRLKVHVKKYKAINSADVELADLTVLAGVNASGKSTLARLFHRLVCVEANFERYAASSVLSSYATRFIQPLEKVVGMADTLLLRRLRNIERNIASNKFKDFGKAVKYLSTTMDELLGQPSFSKLFNDPRFLEALDRDNGGDWEKPTKVSAIGVRNWLESGIGKLENDYSKLISRGEGSSFLFLSQRFQGDFFDPSMLTVLSAVSGSELEIKFIDGEVPIFDTANLAMPFKPIFTPRQSLYISRPSVDMPKVSETKVELNGIEYPREDRPENSADLNISDFIGGAVECPKDSHGTIDGGQWQFCLAGNVKIPVEQCAEGVKSISAILILDKCGLLQSDSLLIIDEPEVHLHPRWIVEMARVLVRLAKFRKVRVLITTHSPDMVHALRDFVANENFSANTSFYLANEDSSLKGRYNFENLGMNIGPIFTVFNQAKDKITSISKDIREGNAE